MLLVLALMKTDISIFVMRDRHMHLVILLTFYFRQDAEVLEVRPDNVLVRFKNKISLA